MYSDKQPQKIQTIVRDVLDDRIIVWINTDRTVLQYNGPEVAKDTGNQTISVEKFLTWASHKVTMEEDQDGTT